MVDAGSYYLSPIDYDERLPSASGISIGQIIRWATDLKVKVLNILVDACQSGSSLTDLREILEQTGRDNEKGPAVSLLVSSTNDQSSWTGENLSQFTNKIHEVLTGVVRAHVSRKFLTLADISAVIPKLQGGSSGGSQDAVHTAINVLGPPTFCKNPLHDGQEDDPHPALLSPYSGLGQKAFAHQKSLRRFYEQLQSQEPVSHLLLLEEIRTIGSQATGAELQLLDLVQHYQRWFTDNFEQNDWSLDFRLNASIASGAFEALFEDESLLFSAFQPVGDALDRDFNYLTECLGEQFLNNTGILHDMTLDSLYQGPRRLSEIYGRLGLRMIASGGGFLEPPEMTSMRAVVEALTSSLESHHVVICETQAAGLALFFCGCIACEEFDIAESVFSLFLHDYLLNKGMFLRSGPTPEQIVSYLLNRPTSNRDSKLDFNHQGLAKPDVFLPVFLLNSGSLDLDQIIDRDLNNLRNRTASIFEISDLKFYSRKVISSGINLNLQVGSDFFCAQEFREKLAEKIQANQLDTAPIGSIKGFAKSVMALVFKDRIPASFDFVGSVLIL